MHRNGSASFLFISRCCLVFAARARAFHFASSAGFSARREINPRDAIKLDRINLLSRHPGASLPRQRWLCAFGSSRLAFVLSHNSCDMHILVSPPSAAHSPGVAVTSLPVCLSFSSSMMAGSVDFRTLFARCALQMMSEHGPRPNLVDPNHSWLSEMRKLETFSAPANLSSTLGT